MSKENTDHILSSLRQQLETDQLLGVREVPIPKSVAASIGRGVSANSGSAPEPASDAQQRQLRVLDESQVSGCRKCQLCETRTNTVFGQGHANARLVFVGEAPGHDEDQQGLAFVGRAGQLLTKMIAAMGMKRDDVFICNLLKCRPPNNRTPAADEIAACSPYLFEQLQTIGPEVVCALGAPAAQTLLGTKEGIGRLRGRFHDFYSSGTPMIGESIPLMPTYHPASLLRSPGEKRKAWEDLKLILAKLDLPIPRAETTRR